MVNPDSIDGIGGDRTFVDALYVYLEQKKELDSDEQITGKEKAERDCCSYYMVVVNQCLLKIDSLPDGDAKCDYLDWLRWNNDIITTELDRFMDIQHLHDLVSIIGVCKKEVEIMVQNYFQLSEEEKAVSNQYVHAYNLVKRLQNQSRRVDKRVLQHAGRLLINYINYLKKRCYVKKLDHNETSFDKLQSEAEHLRIELRGVDNDLAGNIETAIELFKQFRDLDDNAAVGQDKSLKYALLLAHKRATETALETSLRYIRETIVRIKQVALEKIQEAWKITSLFLNPIRHPIETLENLVHAVQHPLQTVEEIWKWAKESPWKFAGIVVGGVFIGAIGVGATLLISSPLITFTLPATALVAIGSISGGVAAGSVLITTAAGAQAARATNEKWQKIAIKEAEEAALKAKNEDEGRRIAEQVLDNHYRRETLREARENAEEEIRKRKERDRLIEAETNRQIGSMNPEQLKMMELQCNTTRGRLEQFLKETVSGMQEDKENYLQIQKDISLIREGRAAAVRLLQKTADTNPLPPELNLESIKTTRKLRNVLRCLIM